MSATNKTPYPDYSGDRKHYEIASNKFETNSRLLLNNDRFLKDIDEVRSQFNIKLTSSLDDNFVPRPYALGSKKNSVEPSKDYDEVLFNQCVREVADKIHLDGDMVSFVKEYVLYGDDTSLRLSHLRKSVVATTKINDSGTEYINLRLNGPVTLKDIESNWSTIAEKIATIYPYAKDKPMIHNENRDITWLIYEMRQDNLSDREIADWLNDNIETDDKTIFTENAVGRKFDRLEKQIGKSYR